MENSTADCWYSGIIFPTINRFSPVNMFCIFIIFTLMSIIMMFVAHILTSRACASVVVWKNPYPMSNDPLPVLIYPCPYQGHILFNHMHLNQSNYTFLPLFGLQGVFSAIKPQFWVRVVTAHYFGSPSSSPELHISLTGQVFISNSCLAFISMKAWPI